MQVVTTLILDYCVLSDNKRFRENLRTGGLSDGSNLESLSVPREYTGRAVALLPSPVVCTPYYCGLLSQVPVLWYQIVVARNGIKQVEVSLSGRPLSGHQVDAWDKRLMSLIDRSY